MGKTVTHKVHHKALHHATKHHKIIHPKIVHPTHPKVAVHKRPHPHGHPHVPAKKPETHLTFIFRTFTHLLKGTLNTARRLTAPITTPVHHFTTKLTTKVKALTTK